LKKKVRLNGVKKFVGSRAHCEAAKGSPEQNKVYCSKEPRLEATVEYGEMVSQGKRTDINDFLDSMKEKLLSESEILEQHPLILAKYPRFVSTARRLLSEKALDATTYVPKPGWQAELVQYLESTPHDRKVRFYVDAPGGTGKSYFAKHYRRNGERPYVITGGKWSDIQYAYSRQSVVIFDWPRSADDSLPYSVIENMKNGYFLQTKYEAVPVYFNSPHVIVFSNHAPDRTKLSEDRWDIHNIRNFI